jgi:hypothetical protein
MPRPKVSHEDTLGVRFSRHGAMSYAAELATHYKKRMFVRPVHFQESHVMGWVFFILESEKQQWQFPA